MIDPAMIDPKTIQPGNQYLVTVPDPIPDDFVSPLVRGSSVKGSWREDVKESHGKVITVTQRDWMKEPVYTRKADGKLVVAAAGMDKAMVPVAWLSTNVWLGLKPEDIKPGMKFRVHVPCPIPDRFRQGGPDDCWGQAMRKLSGNIVTPNVVAGRAHSIEFGDGWHLGIEGNPQPVPLEWLTPIKEEKAVKPKFTIGEPKEEKVEPQFKPGDLVRVVKKAVPADHPVGNPGWVLSGLNQTGMDVEAGKVFVVQGGSLIYPGCFTLKNPITHISAMNPWAYHPLWLEPVGDPRVGDRVRVKPGAQTFPGDLYGWVSDMDRFRGQVHTVLSICTDGDAVRLGVRGFEWSFHFKLVDVVAYDEPLPGAETSVRHEVEKERDKLQERVDLWDGWWGKICDYLVERKAAQFATPVETTLNYMDDLQRALEPSKKAAALYGDHNVRLKQELDLEREEVLRLKLRVSELLPPRPPLSLIERLVRRLGVEGRALVGILVPIVAAFACLPILGMLGVAHGSSLAWRGFKTWLRGQFVNSAMIGGPFPPDAGSIGMGLSVFIAAAFIIVGCVIGIPSLLYWEYACGQYQRATNTIVAPPPAADPNKISEKAWIAARAAIAPVESCSCPHSVACPDCDSKGRCSCKDQGPVKQLSRPWMGTPPARRWF